MYVYTTVQRDVIMPYTTITVWHVPVAKHTTKELHPPSTFSYTTQKQYLWPELQGVPTEMLYWNSSEAP